MRSRTGWLAWLVAAGLALAPTAANGQDVPPPDPVIPLPLYHDRPERGGFYAAVEGVYFRQNNPLEHQVIAVRGLVDIDGSITADLNGTRVDPPGGTPIIIPGTPMPGTFLGSGTPALFADDAGGPGSFQPGVRVTAGWRFYGGSTIEFNYLTLREAKYSAVASILPPFVGTPPNITAPVGTLLTETFLFSPVFNFPSDFDGQADEVALGNPLAAFGIWNAATAMSIEFVQRYDEYNIGGRLPFFETECCRCYCLLGFRHAWIWERFKWRTISESFTGQSSQEDVAIYTNIVSNRLWGPYIGFGNDWYLGRTVVGGFSISADLIAAGLIDFVSERAKYERGDFAIQHKRSRRDNRFVPELQGQFSLWWYPIEGVQVRFGYDLMEFFNTMAAPNPVSFNYGGLDPAWERENRFFHGFRAGIGFIF